MSQFSTVAEQIDVGIKIKDISNINKEIPTLQSAFCQMQHIHTELCNLLEDESKKLEFNFQFKMAYSHLKNLMSQAHELITPTEAQDDAQSVFSTVSDKSVKEKYANATAKAATLEHELQVLDQESLLSKHLLKLQLEKELQKTNTEKEAIIKISGEEVDHRNVPAPHIPPVPIERPPSDQVRPMESPALLKLLESMYEMQAKSKLAPQEPDVFHGNEKDMLKFPIWLRDFEDLIEKSTKEPSERLRYLNKYTKGCEQLRFRICRITQTWSL